MITIQSVTDESKTVVVRGVRETGDPFVLSMTHEQARDLYQALGKALEQKHELRRLVRE